MKKFRSCSFLLALLLFLAPNLTFANQNVSGAMDKLSIVDEKKQAKIPEDICITSPKEIASLADSDKTICSGRAAEGDVVNIDTYTLILSASNTDNMLIPYENYDFTINNLGLFAQEINLKKGDNLVVCTITRNDKKYTFKYVITYSDNPAENLIEKINILSQKDII